MKRIKYLTLVACLFALTGCDLLNALSEVTSSSVEEYFATNNFTENKTTEELTKNVTEHMSHWDVNEKNGYRTYVSVNSTLVNDYYEDNQITINFPSSDKVIIFSSSTGSMFKYYDETNPEIVIYHDKSAYYVVPDLERNINQLVTLDDEHKDIFRYEEFESGYLLLTYNGEMAFITKDLKTAYINENNTNVFTLNDKTIEVPDCELLREGLSRAKTKKAFSFPIPNGYTKSVYSRDYYSSSDPNEWVAYQVILQDLKPTEYISTLKEAGFEVYRGENFGLADYYGHENSGEWIVYDPNHLYAIHMQFLNPIVVVFGSDNWGVDLKVQKADYTFSYYGNTVNTQTDWTEKDKSFMMEKYGTVLPFINLGRHYHLKDLRNNEEFPLHTFIDMDVKCYWIFDNFYKDVITENYGAKLVEAGFTKYVPPVSFDNTYDEVTAWEHTEESMYYECYLNDELDLAVKFLFDDIYGNTIKIFKKSDMKPFWNEETEAAANS